MPMTQSESGEMGGYGGTTTPGACLDSPFEMCGRVATLEYLMSQLLGVDITTNSLSDFTNDMGNILNGSFGGGMLAQLVTQIGKVNAWAVSGIDTLLSGDGSGSIGASNFGGGQIIRAIGPINEFAGDASEAAMYSCAKTEFDPIVTPTAPLLYGQRGGGFYYNIRIAPINENRLTTPPPRRVMCGLSAAANDGGPIFRHTLEEESNRDDPLGLYILFQYSQPRGDATWKVIVRDHPDSGTCLGTDYEQRLADTGVPVELDHIYDLSFRCEPDSNTVQWFITDQTTGSSSAGTIGAPSLCEEISEMGIATYYAGFGIWKCAGILDPNPVAWVHHAWCQALNMEDYPST